MVTEDATKDLWKENRARVDSVSKDVFLISGGAITLSVTVLLGLKEENPLPLEAQCIVSLAWYSLLAAIFLFFLLKVFLIWQSYRDIRMKGSSKNSDFLRMSDRIAWLIGGIGAVVFMVGMGLLIYSATIIIKA